MGFSFAAALLVVGLAIDIATIVYNARLIHIHNKNKDNCNVIVSTKTEIVDVSGYVEKFQFLINKKSQRSSSTCVSDDFNQMPYC